MNIPHRKNQVMILLNMKGIPYEEFTSSMRIKEHDALIAFYETGYIELHDNYTRFKSDIESLIKYISENY